ncbi:MAG: TonB-dependent siderophore receptor, partial [Opitutaceae bacterium]
IAIRGFANRNTLVDGVPGGSFVPTYLVDRIEVVKGPNTLYGQSDPGGLVNTVTKQPLGHNKAYILQKFGSFNQRETNVDFNSAAHKQLKFRVLGAFSETDGWRWADGSQFRFAAVASSLQLTKSTKLLFSTSGSIRKGIPSNRGAFAFEVIPTDLNGDGDTNDRVNGIPEAAARYNSTFLPREYTAATVNNWFEQKNHYLQSAVRQGFGKHVNFQYVFTHTANDSDLTFREFNTFSPAGMERGSHGVQRFINKTDVHTVNTLATFDTGKLAHQVLAGFRVANDFGYGEQYGLRAGVAPEAVLLDTLTSGGRVIRQVLTKAEVLAKTPIWLDAVPTAQELRVLGTQQFGANYGVQKVTTYYLNDSIAAGEGRIRVLGGIRRVRITSDTLNFLTRRVVGVNDQQNTSAQGGVVFGVTKTISAYANSATAFNPNGRDPAGEFYPPEASRAYEAGFRFDDFLNGKISGSLAVFNIDKKNVVRSDFSPVLFRNVAEITDDRARGIDADLFINPVPNCQVVLNYSYLDAHVVRTQTEARNLRLEGAAPQRLTMWINYSIDKGPLHGLRFGGGLVSVKGPVQQFGTSDNQLVIENGYTEFSAFARYSTKLLERRVTFGFNVANLTDVVYFRSRGGLNTPRQFAFSIALDL